MEQLHILNISKNNMDKVINAFDKSSGNDILINISNNLLFIDVFAALIYMQHNQSLVNKITAAPVITDDKSYIILDDEFCKKAGLQYSERDIDSIEFFKKYSSTYFYLKTSGSTGAAPPYVWAYIRSIFTYC